MPTLLKLLVRCCSTSDAAMAFARRFVSRGGSTQLGSWRGGLSGLATRKLVLMRGLVVVVVVVVPLLWRLAARAVLPARLLRCLVTACLAEALCRVHQVTTFARHIALEAVVREERLPRINGSQGDAKNA